MKYEENTTSSASIFFITEGDSNYTGDRGVHFNVISSDDSYKDYYVDLSQKLWDIKYNLLKRANGSTAE